jgi:hypothetical protein
MRLRSLAVAVGMVGVGLGALRAADAPAPAPLYAQNFETLKEGKPPEELLVINGEFEVKKVDGNAVIEMAGDPLESKGILVGPAENNTACVSARIWATASGKRTPEFGVGAGGPGNYRLWVMPAVGEVQLIKGDDVMKARPYAWASGQWTRLKLHVRKTAEGKFRVEGKAWADGKDEPKEWGLNFDDTEDAPAGKAGVFGVPYSGTPIRFDEIVVEAASK